MRVATVRAKSTAAHERLDCKYYASPGVAAAERLALSRAAGMRMASLGGPSGVGKVWMPPRLKHVYAVPGEPGKSYLRPYDVFEYLPSPADVLSLGRTKKAEQYAVKPGTILQTRSGRNLGPAVIVDAYLANFLISDDMIRVEIEDASLRAYVLAYLRTPSGQELIKRDKSGSVIDHISVGHVAALPVPLVPTEVMEKAAASMSRAVQLCEQARQTLTAALRDFEKSLPGSPEDHTGEMDWTVQARDLGFRLDAASFYPRVRRVREQLRAVGGVPVVEVAEVKKPAGRYKTYYVEPEYGRPILSGAQVLQLCPVNLRYMSPRAFKNPAPYALRAGWCVYQADGRAEEGLGVPVMVTPDRDGWLASGHVGRLVPRSGTDAGWLYLATRVQHTQLQLKALASGSVVDSTFLGDMQQVILPPLGNVDGSSVTKAWSLFSDALAEEHHATECIEKALDEASGFTPTQPVH